MNKIPFGFRQGVLVHISEVERGLDCDCTCPECGCPLQARKGLVREHHFAHSTETSDRLCGGGVESVLHQFAKRVIEAAGYLVTPAFEARLSPPNEDMKVEIPGEKLSFSRMEVEESQAFANRRVDVVGYYPGGRLFIEIAVTHRVKGKKLHEVKAANEALLEIELPESLLFTNNPAGQDSLREAIVDSLKYKRWVFHPEGNAAYLSLKKRVIERHKPNTIRSAASQRPQQLPQTEEPSRREGHLPSRSNYEDREAYVRAMHKFLMDAKYEDQIQKQVFDALRRSGNITDEDLKMASNLGVSIK